MEPSFVGNGLVDGGVGLDRAMIARAERPVTSTDPRPNPRLLVNIIQVF